MSGKDTLHIPWAFSLNEAPSLPLIGEHHPLRRESVKWLLWANGAALLVGILAFAAWSAASRRETAAPVTARGQDRSLHRTRRAPLDRQGLGASDRHRPGGGPSLDRRARAGARRAGSRRHHRHPDRDVGGADPGQHERPGREAPATRSWSRWTSRRIAVPPRRSSWRWRRSRCACASPPRSTPR